MRISSLFLVPLIGALVALPAFVSAEEPGANATTASAVSPDEATAPPAVGEPTSEAATPGDEAVEPSAEDEAATQAESAPTSEPAEAPDEGSKVTLGPVGYDAQGQPGRVHVVVRGDTLWDISEAYLGTPWVWPSVWKDNQEIRNPHLIYPGDRIWITPNEMRRISEEEAAALLAGQPKQDLPASLEDAPLGTDGSAAPARHYPYSHVEAMGVVSPEQVEGAASIVDSPVERVWLADPDPIFVGLGSEAAEVGDQLTVFRSPEKVLDPETGRLLGYHVEVLGWAEVTRVGEESSVATIRHSFSEMRRGDRLLPREAPSPDFEVHRASEPVEGRIVFMPAQRTQMASADIVYLDRGRMDGLAVGNPLEVYRPGAAVPERARDTDVRTPDWVVAKLLVVSAKEETAVALVTHSTTELQRGDRFRTASDGSLR